MRYKSINAGCSNLDCEEGQEAKPKAILAEVSSLDELKIGDPVDEICESCGEQLRVAVSAARINFGKGSGGSQAHDDSLSAHGGTYFISLSDPGTVATVVPSLKMMHITTPDGSNTQRDIEQRGEITVFGEIKDALLPHALAAIQRSKEEMN